MKHIKSILVFLIVFVLIFSTACSTVAPTSVTTAPPATEAVTTTVESTTAPVEKIGGELILATTTSTQNSGLLDYILPDFTEKTGIDIKVVAVGSGAALQMGRDGEADVLLSHAKPSEEIFVSEGHGLERFDVMYNDFVILGPESDTAGIKGMNVIDALKTINEKKSIYLTRGDNSGTAQKELELWKTANIVPEGDWYKSVGKGMGDTINMTSELMGYTLSDRATYLSMKENIELSVLVEGDPSLFNQYGVIAVNPAKNSKINAEQAEAFVSWILSDETQELIGTYIMYGEVLFTPNAK